MSSFNPEREVAFLIREARMASLVDALAREIAQTGNHELAAKFREFTDMVGVLIKNNWQP